MENWMELLTPEIANDCRFATQYSEAERLLSEEQARGIVLPMQVVPFDRDPSYHLSAILALQPRGFYFTAKAGIKNLFLLGESHTLHYTHDFIPLYVRDFNSNVKLEKIEEKDVHNHEYVISQHPSSDAVLLSPQEFIPPSGAGVYTILCATEDVEFREKCVAVHDEEAMVISNLQRSMHIACIDRHIKGVHIHKDHNGHLHGALAIGNEALLYESFSQSTSHEFVENWLSKM